MAVYVSCGGTSAANGIYTLTGAQFYEQLNGTHTISYDGNVDKWFLNSVAQALYSVSVFDAINGRPVTDTDWGIENGSSPAIKTFGSFSYDTTDLSANRVFNKITITNAETAINGTYTWDTNAGPGAAGAYVHSNNTYMIYASFGNWYLTPVGSQESIWYQRSGGGFSDEGAAGWTPPVDFYNSPNWTTGDLGTQNIAASLDLSLVCGAIGNGGGNAGNNYTHSRIVDAITITGAGGSYTGANGTYYASRNWASGTSEANGDLPIFVHSNGNYIIYYNIAEFWFAISTGIGGYELYSYAENPNILPVSSPQTWDRQDAPTGNVISTSSSVRRFFVRTSGNNAYLRHTS